MAPARRGRALVVPVKRLDVAKTRLALPAALRRDVALAVALDTVAGLLATDGVTVVVVTDDPAAAKPLERLGAHVTSDVPDAGLNPALEHGVRVAASLHPGAAVGSVSSDLAAVRPEELAAVLDSANGHHAAVVADSSGLGTAVLLAADVAGFRPRFGSESRRRHVESGAVDLTDEAGPSLRRDVDTLDDLREAAALGVGPAMSQLLTTSRELRELVAARPAH